MNLFDSFIWAADVDRCIGQDAPITDPLGRLEERQ
jgi:hypothetical protein